MEKQIQLHSVNTRAFYTEDEKKLNKEIYSLGNEVKILREYISYQYLNKDKEMMSLDEYITYKNRLSDLYTKKATDPLTEDELKEQENIKEKIKDIYKTIKKEKPLKRKAYKRLNKREKAEYDKTDHSRLQSEEFKKVLYANEKYKEKLKALTTKNNELLKEIKKDENVSLIRTLNPEVLQDYNKVSVFDSYLVRIMGLNENELTKDLLIVFVAKKHNKLMEQLIKNGCIVSGERFQYFTSSAGQIRTEKLVLIKESIWIDYEKTLMCGLTVADINAKGGSNINKYLAYLALCNSATDKWKEFDIDQCIVLDDFETTIENAEVDFIDRAEKTTATTKEIKEGEFETITKTHKGKWEISSKVERIPKDITITHSDGCGWILPSLSKKSFMFRLPWFKGLVVPCNYINFIEKYRENNYKVKDIWGDEWDLKEKNIKVILFKSQFKMWKYYENWEDYKQKYKDNKCHASKCNVESDFFKPANFNYQMWQTLTDIEDHEIKYFTDKIDKFVTEAYTDRNVMLKMLDATKDNKKMNYFQKALMLYPELLNDYHVKEELSSTINKVRKGAKYGKFKIDATYTYLIPDLFAWMQYTFLEDKNPKGLLKDGEVYCNLYKNEELVVNRSPHLWREHAVRSNIVNQKEVDGIKLSDWYITNGVYTSCHDLISKILQFDNDGDKSLVVAEPSIVDVCKRNMEGVVPLYYEMGKAEPVQINQDTIFKGLDRAFKSGNVGMYSNELSVLWNSDLRKNENLAKIICALNNFNIDSAKTMLMPKPKKDIAELMKELNKIKLPYFFQFAKDKHINEVEKLNDSTVNRICAEIENIVAKKFNFKGCGDFKKDVLMYNPRIKINENIAKSYDEENAKKDINFAKSNNDKEESSPAIFKTARENFKDVCKKEGVTLKNACDMIVKHVYKNYKDKKKTLMWDIFGSQILRNIEMNLKNISEGYIMCQCCGKRVKAESNRQKMCKSCSDKKKKEDKLKRQKKAREKVKKKS